MGFPEGAIIYKSSQKNLFSDIKIQGEVISINYDKDFIVAVQQKKAVQNLLKTKCCIISLLKKS